MLFAVKTPHIYQNNTSVHGKRTRQQNKLHIISVRISPIQRDVYYSSIKYSTNYHKIYSNLVAPCMFYDFIKRLSC